jgi:Kef-type K+ transport system membrane component KefB/mannitol/fructose-specific phosphotransferase system IIA component (Ntr-type)
MLAASVLSPSELTALLLSLAVLLGLARALGELARHLRQPAVLGEIIAGILLGPTVFGALTPGAFEWLFPVAGPTRIAVEGFITLSATLLLFVVGLEVDLSTVWRQGRATLMVSALGLALPFSLGFSLGWFLPGLVSAGNTPQPLAFALFLGIALSITALPVIAKIMMDLNLAKSDMGTLIISSAMLNDLVGWIGFAVVLALMPVAAATGSAPPVALTITLTLLFLALMLTLGRFAADRALPYVQAHTSWPGGVLGFVFVTALVCAALTEQLGIHSIFGAFIAGVAVGDSRHLTRRTRETIENFVTHFFAPVFFASIGLRVNFIDQFVWQTVVIVFGVALVAKVTGCFLGARWARLGRRESWAVGFGMASQGTVGIILGQLALGAGLISEPLMVAIVIMALGTSLLSGPMMQKILRQETKRRLVDLLTDRHIMLRLEAHESAGAIQQLTDRAGQILNLAPDQLNEAVMERERVMATGLPNGLAVPHARLNAIKKPCVILGRCSTGVDFDSPDGQPARLIFLLLTPLEQPESQIELLNLVSQTFADDALRNEVLTADKPTEVLAILNRAGGEA